MKTLLGKKLGMTQVFTEDSLIPVTVVEAGPCVITQIKTEENDGYNAVQIAYGDIKKKNVNKPMQGHFKKAKTEPARHLVEYRVEEDNQELKEGQKIECDIFEAGELTKVEAFSKGKGFQGVVKRWGFAGGPGGHGSHFHRAPGSIGMAATPSRVFKGMKGPGRLGGKKVTVKNLEIIKVDKEQNVLLIKGAVPGANGALVVIEATGKSVKNPAKLIEYKVEFEEKPEEKATGKEEAKKEEKAKETKQEEVKTQKAEEKTEEKSESKAEEKEVKKEEAKTEKIESRVESQESKEQEKEEKKEEAKAEDAKVEEKKEEEAEDKKEESNKEKETGGETNSDS